MALRLMSMHVLIARVQRARMKLGMTIAVIRPTKAKAMLILR